MQPIAIESSEAVEQSYLSQNEDSEHLEISLVPVFVKQIC